LTREQRYGRRIRETVLGAGFSEAALTSFLAPDDLPLTGGTFAIRVANPMTVEQTYLRPTLVPGLLRAARHNAAHGVTSIRLFEMGVAFVAWPPEESRPVEELRLGAVVAGHAGGDAWHAPARDFDAYDTSGLVELVMSCMGIRGWELGECDDYPFHPGRSASVVVDGTAVGRFGEVRPSVRKALDLPGGVAAIELALDALMTRAASELKVRELARFPAITRDISLDVDEDVPAAEVEATIRRAAGESLESVVLLNVYRGEPVASGRRNLLYRLTLRVSDRTLTSEEADQVRNAVVEAVAAAHGADVR
jgi:phenylalanyl-tRNA synthetase beta chain